ncbi:GSCFA domain-containing protein [Aquimarina sp. 2201CG14-23]|uniref:GSCFA domain-containing protein n=1 Tax=Aquimarina mycalae TaxID=3040073 RepID=UPI002477F3FF|nr:GSCFA domain-containing protein [Aquimarina sp. 2201CG14-23]MDH7447681.1 GSCFA domain-containing protein [Aquimarina sp. 2201CG14-23]
MNLQTKIPLQPQQPKIDYESEVLMLGSCFAENIGSKFEYFKFKTLINPFGILFHPKAIETFLWMATQKEAYTETDLFFHNEQWHCFDAHSKLSSPNQDQLLQSLNDALKNTFVKIQSASHICITLGTAWVYRLQTLDMIVANCHKVPQKEFKKELLSIEEINQCLQNSIGLIKSLNPDVKIICTVSPVRHSKDGFVENNLSKSHLIASIHKTISEVNNCSYFPAYEIVMDELRDYRFYDRDMIHPNNIAIDYIWEIFKQTWISDNTLITMNKVKEIQHSLSHRPFNPSSQQHQLFLQKLESKIKRLQEQYSYMAFN